MGTAIFDIVRDGAAYQVRLAGVEVGRYAADTVGRPGVYWWRVGCGVPAEEMARLVRAAIARGEVRDGAWRDGADAVPALRGAAQDGVAVCGRCDHWREMVAGDFGLCFSLSGYVADFGRAPCAKFRPTKKWVAAPCGGSCDSEANLDLALPHPAGGVADVGNSMVATPFAAPELPMARERLPEAAHFGHLQDSRQGRLF